MSIDMMRDKTDLPLEKAVAVLLRSQRYTPSVERLPLAEALGRVSAQDVRAPFDLPPFDRSPLDGYAVIAADTADASRGSPAVLEVTGQLCAGMMPAASIGRGQAVRIMTGAPIPAGADCVVRQEDTERGGGAVRVYVPHRPFQNFSPRGSDVRRGTCCIRRGEVLDAVRLGILASLGLAEAAVLSRPVVGLLTTGDELAEPGTPLSAGKIYNSNLYLLQARLRELDCLPRVLPPCGDDAHSIARSIHEALPSLDFLITTGGVSVGERDFLPEVCSLLHGELLFKGIAIKPGSPAMAFVHRGKCVLCLSGNPFAAAATLELLARPVLAQMRGLSRDSHRRTSGVLQDEFPKASRGRRFIRAYIVGEKVFLPKGESETHSSGALISMSGCNCMIDIPANSGPLSPGQRVSVVIL